MATRVGKEREAADQVENHPAKLTSK